MNTNIRSALALAFALVAGLITALASAAVLADSGKLDAGLRRQLEKHTTISPRARSLESEMVAANVQFTGAGLEAMKARGVTIRSVLGDLATVLIPIDRLADVAALPQVLRLEVPSRPVARLDKSVPYTRADQLRSGTLAAGWTGGTGKGVLVGVIDSGIDISHGDFLDADGKTRILRMWNQRNVTGGTPPMGSDGTTPLYGAECDAAAINALIGTAASAASPCNPDDNGNHGSHVAGIAAGNGRGTGNGLAAGRLVGMAPEADLLVANSIDKAVNAQGDPVTDAIAWMTRVAKQLNKSLVINLSLGSYFGARDGTGSFQLAIDNASGPGVIIAAAAGNEGSAPIRTEIAPMTQGQTVGVTFRIPAGRTAEQLEFWSNGDNQYAVQITCPNGAQTAIVTAGNSLPEFDTAGCGKVEITSTAPNPANGDRQYSISLKGGTNALAAGDWILSVRADAVPVTQTLGIVCGETEEGAVFTGAFVPPLVNGKIVTKGILTDAASARRSIAVAALNTNYMWNTAAGPTDKQLDNGPLGDVGSFSSRGPRRVCSANAKYIDVSTASGQRNNSECTKPVMKPDLAAPGSYIMSALAGAAKAAATAADVEADGMHVAYMGTSMATPHVTGAVALLLQANPTLTPEEAKRILFTTLQTNQYTQAANLPAFAPGVDMPTNPDDAWGYGAMDTAMAVRQATGNVLATGWNLVGNTLATTLDVAATFGAANTKDLITTVWKWVPGASVWAFYAPSLGVQGGSVLQDYVTGKGYQLLTTINPGEGFWVNAKPATGSTQVVVPALSGMAFSYGPANLNAGWNLVATAPNEDPAAFNTRATAAGKTPVTLWAWETAGSNWYFYAPSLAAQGGTKLSDYITGKSYLDFVASGKKLGSGSGFWVNSSN